MNTPHTTTVLIHGFGFDHRIWYPVELAFEGHHVIYLSLPGFALERTTEPYTIADLAQKYWRHIADVVDGPVHLVGHSMGGYVCMEMVAQKPDRVVSIALIHSHVFADPSEKKEARTATIREIEEKGREPFLNKFIPGLFGHPDSYKEIAHHLIARALTYEDSAWIHGMTALRDRSDHAETLKNITVPVLMLMGEADTAVKPELAHKQAPLSGRVTLHMYPGIGHLGMYENTARMIEDLIRFYAPFA